MNTNNPIYDRFGKGILDKVWPHMTTEEYARYLDNCTINLRPSGIRALYGFVTVNAPFPEDKIERMNRYQILKMQNKPG
jgi:hypothetical protein